MIQFTSFRAPIEGLLRQSRSLGGLLSRPSSVYRSRTRVRLLESYDSCCVRLLTRGLGFGDVASFGNRLAFGFPQLARPFAASGLSFHWPIKVEIGSYAGHVKRVITTSGAVLMKKIGVQHKALFVWPSHAERVLVFVP